MRESIKDFLQKQKYKYNLTDEELASKNGISLDSLRSIRDNNKVSQLMLLKIVKANKIGLGEAKERFIDFDFTRDTLKGELRKDYDFGCQSVKLKSLSVEENKSKSIRVVMEEINRKYVYVKTIPIYSKEFKEFEESFNLDILNNGCIKEVEREKFGTIFVEQDKYNFDLLSITFRKY